VQAFNLYDLDRDGYISVSELSAFLSAFLRLMLVPRLAAATRHLTPAQLASDHARTQRLVTRLVAEATEEIFRLADLDHDNKVNPLCTSAMNRDLETLTPFGRFAYFPPVNRSVLKNL
jgi:Ca2+-binding EF-hand superfamily protein